MHAEVRGWIVDIMSGRSSLLAIAFRQRAKFEGWLKFELAAWAQEHGASAVSVEASPDPTSRSRSDVSFEVHGVAYHVELKTPNSNWRLPGVMDATRPITKNISEIAADARKLARVADHGIVAFVLFPLPRADVRWHEYLERISSTLGTALSSAEHTAQITVPLSGSAFADAVVCCFEVGGPTRGGAAA